MGYNPRFKGQKHTEEWKRQKSLSMKGNTWATAGKGRKLTEEHRKKLSDSAIKRVAEGRHNNYKGGVTAKNKKLRYSSRFKLWRETVFERDDYTCRKCGARNKKGVGKTIELHPHHIKPFSLFPELRFEISNGLTLCADCHKKTDSWGRPKSDAIDKVIKAL